MSQDQTKARQVLWNVKVLITVFCDCRGVMYQEFKSYFYRVARSTRNINCKLCAICTKQSTRNHPDLWKKKNWHLQHDNVPAHTSLLVPEFLTENNAVMLLQPPYSPLARCAFFLFPKLKKPMKGRRYATIEDIKTASKEELTKIAKNDFFKCFEDWKKRWHKGIISKGEYFVGDNIILYMMMIMIVQFS
ncbi:unnamed protein product [Euphydryas editha]|uniref:Transposase n=1 Tax=Euphydryas editha TaxID=104508 RepID=A0AAU9UK80_EUPED|nr:unnamed protein product [Euphydryas editha]